MFVAVRWAQVRLYYCKANRTHYVQLGDDALFQIKPNIATIIGHKLQIEVKDVKDIVSMQQYMKNEEQK